MNIRSRKDTKNFLKTAPKEWSQIIAVRAALRVFPLWRPPDGTTDMTLSLCRCLFVSGAAAVWPSLEMTRAALAADAAASYTAFASATDVSAPAAYTANAAADAAKAAAAKAATDAAAYAAKAASNAASYAAKAGAGVWREIEADANYLTSSALTAPSNLPLRLLAPLWDQAPRPIFIKSWSARKAELLNIPDQHWSPWIEWYNRILTGETLTFSGLTHEQDQAFCVRLATESNDFWNRDVAFVNKDILDRLTELRSTPPIETPTIPPQRPATIQPVWRGDTLTLPDDPAIPGDGAELDEALASLREDLEELADDLTLDAPATNIDVRLITFVRRLAERVPPSRPTQSQMFRLGLAQSNLSIYLNTVVKDEWPGFWAARIIGTMIHFDRVMGQLPDWRDFVRNAENDIATPAEAEQIANTVEAISDQLTQVTDGTVDAIIPETMAPMAADIRGLQDEGLAFNKQLIAYDARESARNTFKALADPIVKWLEPGFTAEHKDFRENVGRTLHRAIVGTGIGLGVWAASAVSGIGLADLAAAVLKSPEIIRFLGGKEGWIVPFMTLLASVWPKKK